MGKETVIFVDDSNEDNKGRGGNSNNNNANMVAIQSLDKKLYYAYVHLHKDGALNKNNQKVKVGERNPGDKIGEIGNSGDSSEPHLHVGIYTLDADGFLRSLPMSFNKIRDGNGNIVSGVPADDNFYSS
jgi:murein DD-endopeptidase MepM/ murein hydrolase activator NlpD